MEQSTPSETQQINREGKAKGGKTKSYRDSVISSQQRRFSWEDEISFLENEVSDDDLVENGDNEAWFSMGMTREEKLEARRPWCLNIIIKLIGRSTDYHYL